MFSLNEELKFHTTILNIHLYAWGGKTSNLLEAWRNRYILKFEGRPLLKSTLSVSVAWLVTHSWKDHIAWID
jgi:hypothetical protein